VADTNRIVSGVDAMELELTVQRMVAHLKGDMIDMKLDVRDYELAETRHEQLRHAQDARRRLDQIRKSILTASDYGIFSSIDVAQLTAQADRLIDDLE